MSVAALPVPGPIERLAPRARLLATLILVIAVTLLHGVPAAAAACACGALLAVLSGQGLAPLARRLVHVEGFMALLLLMLPFTMAGTPLITLGPVAASVEGLLRATTIALKVNAAMLVVFALLGTMEPVRIGHAARRLGAPLRLVQLFLFTTRHVEIFRNEIRRLREAMRARGFVPRSTPHGWRAYGNLAGMVLVRSLERASRVEEAMRCRAFDGRLPAIGLDEEGHGTAACPCLALAAGASLILLDRLT
ncbi:MAG: cobalt ECF transporter T component CbiQ [Zavarzinia sp.]|nr:cobalt ECF transporter T component CbiQ [Zavarzinia sp.]